MQPEKPNWRSGKRLSAKQIVENFPRHKTYVEPFAGRAYVFLKNDKYEKAVLNDIDCQPIRELKKQKCSLEDKSQCQKLKQAKVTCGRDWKEFLKLDSKDTVFYLDPPYESSKDYGWRRYKYNNVPLKEILQNVKKLKGTVFLSYSPERKSEICNSKTGFTCKTIKTTSFSNPTSEILGIKRSRND